MFKVLLILEQIRDYMFLYALEINIRNLEV